MGVEFVPGTDPGTLLAVGVGVGVGESVGDAVGLVVAVGDGETKVVSGDGLVSVGEGLVVGDAS